MPQTFPDWLRAQMAERGMTQRALAEAMDVSESYVSYIVRGERPALNDDVRRKLARALGMSLSDLERRLNGLPPPPKYNRTQRAIIEDRDLSPDQRSLMLAVYDQLRHRPAG